VVLNLEHHFSVKFSLSTHFSRIILSNGFANSFDDFMDTLLLNMKYNATKKTAAILKQTFLMLFNGKKSLILVFKKRKFRFSIL